MSDWVKCPVCGEPDMQKQTDEEGNSLIFCVNHACLSNGGSNFCINSQVEIVADDLRQRIIKSAREYAHETWVSISSEERKALENLALRSSVIVLEFQLQSMKRQIERLK